MSIQILDIVLFSHDGRLRKLVLRTGDINIITGASKTGKSALIHIIDYCFGSSECEVPEGPIRRAVAWFGLRLKLSEGQAFVARRCPIANAAYSEDCFIEIGKSVEIPKADVLKQTTNTKGLIDLLSGWCGITDNLYEPPLGQTRLALTATVRHALALCFQPQDEIIRRQQLFHKANDSFFSQGLKDTLPYFLGAVENEYIRKKEELKRLREQLRSYERQLTEIISLRGEGFGKSDSLLAQARDVGLTNIIPNSWEETIAVIRKLVSTPLIKTDIKFLEQSEYSRLTKERAFLLDEQRCIREEISAARIFEQEGQGFSKEATEQRARLKSIGIFEDSLASDSCPLCSQTLKSVEQLPAVDMVKTMIDSLSSHLESVSLSTPKIEKAIAELERKFQSIQQKLTKNRSEMESVRNIDHVFAQTEDDTGRKAHILGRISLYAESLPDLPDIKVLEQQVESLRIKVSNLEIELSDERVKERLESIISILSQWMTKWAQELDLEHSKSPLRFDLKKLTIVADTIDGPVPMNRMGSGENWVGYHLIAHLALHQWFVQRTRPVPSFLFFDQPSQIYFPTEKEIKESSENDWSAVSRMFKLIFDVMKGIFPNLQIIITEHADINDKWYQEAIIERWREGLKLVPEDWPRAKEH